MGCSPLQRLREIRTIEYIIAQYERTALPRDEFLTDEECLREAVRARLHRVGYGYPELAAVSQQTREQLRILRRRYDEYIGYAGQHERRQRIIDHRLVIDRHQLL